MSKELVAPVQLLMCPKCSLTLYLSVGKFEPESFEAQLAAARAENSTLRERVKELEARAVPVGHDMKRCAMRCREDVEHRCWCGCHTSVTMPATPQSDSPQGRKEPES